MIFLLSLSFPSLSLTGFAPSPSLFSHLCPAPPPFSHLFFTHSYLLSITFLSSLSPNLPSSLSSPSLFKNYLFSSLLFPSLLPSLSINRFFPLPKFPYTLSYSLSQLPYSIFFPPLTFPSLPSFMLTYCSWRREALNKRRGRPNAPELRGLPAAGPTLMKDGHGC